MYFSNRKLVLNLIMFKRFYLPITLITLACQLTGSTTKMTNSSQGLAEYVSKIYSGVLTDTTEPMFMLGVKIWYKDSMAIEENATLRYVSDSKNRHSRNH